MVKSGSSLDDIEIHRRRSFQVKDFFERYREEMGLELLSSEETLVSEITEPTIHRPGLAMTGFTDVYSHQRVQVIGSTEWAFIESQGSGRRKEIFRRLSRFKTPLWILTHNLPPHEELLDICNRFNMPLMRTRISTLKFTQMGQKILGEWFAPYSPVHASLVDVYGVGMLYVGSSNIGKSECVLDLVERGHRLVADDIVKLVRLGDSIIGRSNHVIGHHMEIRGIGVIDIPRLFGIHAVRKVKKVEIVVELQFWREGVNYDRTGLRDSTVDIMGRQIPKVVVPISPGKNITVISEVIAMNTLMKLNGIDTAAEFNRRLIEIISDKKKRRSSEIDFDSSSYRTDFYE